MYFLTVIGIMTVTSCKSDTTVNLTLKKIFESLPAVTNVNQTNMKVKIVAPGNGPEYYVLTYNNMELMQSSKIFFQVINNDLAFGEGLYGTLYLANKDKTFIVDSNDLLFTGKIITTELRGYELRIDKDKKYSYIKGNIWNTDGSSILKTVYFKYSLLNNELTNEKGQNVKMTPY